MITAVAFVVLAAAGTLARWAIRLGRVTAVGGAAATLAANLAGAFALGVVTARGADPTVTAVGVAGLGALTTFSTFVADAVTLTEEGRRVVAAGYVALSMGGGVVLADLGLRLG